VQHPAVQVAVVLLMTGCAQPVLAQPDSIALRWSNAALQGVRDAKLGAPVVARALAIVHTCMYDAWAAYDERATGTELGGLLRRPAQERTLANKQAAISYAAFRALSDVLSVDTRSVYVPLMRELGYDPSDQSTDIETPAGVGNVACGAVLAFRHHDQANQLGDLAPGSYSDWTGYVSVNAPSLVPPHAAPADANHWQPLVYVDANGNLVTQQFAGAQWCYVAPFALSHGEDFRDRLAPKPAEFGSADYLQQAEELVVMSAALTDKQKVIADYWADGPKSEQPPGHWLLFARFVSVRDHHTLDEDVKMTFALTNAMFDAGIAAWDAKRAYDSVRPATAIPLLFRGKTIRSWGGPGKGTIEMDGGAWIPYQPLVSPTPPFPDYVSGHSTYSAAGARILTLWTGNDRFGASVTVAAGNTKVEPGIAPTEPVTLRWETFTDAADEAGLSRRYGGIHFARADLAGRALGRLVADKAWLKAQEFFTGTGARLPHAPATMEEPEAARPTSAARD
jgi:hypothetical protein